MTQQPWREQLIAYRWRLSALFGGVLAPLCVFGALAEEVWSREGFGWDAPLMRFVHGYATPTRDALMISVSTVGGARGMIPLCVLAVVALALRRRLREATFVALAYAGAEGLDGLAKAFFRSERPHLWAWPVHEAGYGFPSGHAIGSIALLSALVVLLWPTPWRVPALIVAAVTIGVVGLSRVYLGVHYPSDVLAAWVAGLAWTMGLHLIMTSRMMGRSRQWHSTRVTSTA